MQFLVMPTTPRPVRALISFLCIATAMVVPGQVGASTGITAPQLEATSVGLKEVSFCNRYLADDEIPDEFPPSIIRVGLDADGPVEHLQVEIGGLDSPAEVVRSEPADIGPVDSKIDVELPYQGEVPATFIRVWMGSADPSATSAVEWTQLFSCDPTEMLYVGPSCFGPYGSCPTNANEAQAEGIVVERGAPIVDPGGDIDVSITGCFAVDAGLFLARGDNVLDEAANEFPHGEPLVAGLEVPADIPPGTTLDLWAYCGNDPDQAYIEEWTATVTPDPVPTAPAALPQPGTPAFTG